VSNTKGKACEKFVRDHIDAWESRGWLAFRNNKAAHNAKGGGEPADFTVFLPNGIGVLLECKETESDTIKLYLSTERIARQYNNLCRMVKLGHEGFWVVQFKRTNEVCVFSPRQAVDGATRLDSLGKLVEVLTRLAEGE
jgi:hypothetical protein